MVAQRAVIVNGVKDAVAVLHASCGSPITLLSAPGAAQFAGCMWWRDMVQQAKEIVPHARPTDVLDCVEATGLALSALRIGQRAIVLREAAPGYAQLLAVARDLGAEILPVAPPALDLAERGAVRRLGDWLHGTRH